MRLLSVKLRTLDINCSNGWVELAFGLKDRRSKSVFSRSVGIFSFRRRASEIRVDKAGNVDSAASGLTGWLSLQPLQMSKRCHRINLVPRLAPEIRHKVTSGELDTEIFERTLNRE